MPASGTPPQLAPRAPPGRRPLPQRSCRCHPASTPRSSSGIEVPKPRAPGAGRCLCVTAEPGTQPLPKAGALAPEPLAPSLPAGELPAVSPQGRSGAGPAPLPLSSDARPGQSSESSGSSRSLARLPRQTPASATRPGSKYAHSWETIAWVFLLMLFPVRKSLR